MSAATVTTLSATSSGAGGTASRFLDVDSDVDNFNFLTGLADKPIVSLDTSMTALPAHESTVLKSFARSSMLAAKHKAKSHPKMTVDQIAAIHLYTQGTVLYGRVNAFLRARDRAGIRPYLPFIKLLLSALHTLPLETRVVWRGIPKHELEKFLQLKGNTIVWWGFSSCTKSVEQTEKFLTKFGTQTDHQKCTLFNVECRSCVDITALSAYPEEEEVLLMPGTVMKVVGALKMTSVVHLRESEEEPLIDYVHPQLTSHASSAEPDIVEATATFVPPRSKSSDPLWLADMNILEKYGFKSVEWLRLPAARRRDAIGRLPPDWEKYKLDYEDWEEFYKQSGYSPSYISELLER